MICIGIDELTQCLKDTLTGDILETEVVRIKRESFLQKFNVKTGWYINWASLAKDNEIYALVIKGTVDIQGLVAIEPSDDQKAIYITWMVAAPHNNPQIADYEKYTGVGGHLFAIAIRESIKRGYNGDVFGFAMDEELLDHYINEHGATFVGMLHPYHFMIVDEAAKEIIDGYTYEESSDEL